MSRCNTIIAAALAAAALAAPAAVAQPQDLRNPDNRTVDVALAQERYYSSYGSGAGEPAQDLRSPDTRDAAAGRGAFNAPEVVVVRTPGPAPAGAGGIDWGDVGIGAGGMLGLALLALGGTFAVVHRRHGARPMATTG